MSIPPASIPRLKMGFEWPVPASLRPSFQRRRRKFVYRLSDLNNQRGLIEKCQGKELFNGAGVYTSIYIIMFIRHVDRAENAMIWEAIAGHREFQNIWLLSLIVVSCCTTFLRKSAPQASRHT